MRMLLILFLLALIGSCVAANRVCDATMHCKGCDEVEMDLSCKGEDIEMVIPAAG